jgi:hypothetical protein
MFRRPPLPLTKPLDTVFNIAEAAGTPVEDKDNKIPFKFTEKIGKITIKLQPPKLSPADIGRMCGPAWPRRV